MSNPDHHAEMEEHVSYGKRIQELEAELELLRAFLDRMADRFLGLSATDEAVEAAADCRAMAARIQNPLIYWCIGFSTRRTHSVVSGEHGAVKFLTEADAETMIAILRELDKHGTKFHSFKRTDCKHVWETDKSGLIDTCKICGEERA